MHFGAQRLELLLVRDAEMLLLVDDDEAEVLELDRLAEQRMGADDDVDAAVGDALLDRGQLAPPTPAARPAPTLHRKAAEALGEGLGVLARQQRGRHHHRDLLAVHRGDEGGAQRHLGLAEADVAADQPVHRPAGGEIVERRRRSRPAGRRSPRRESRRRIRRRAPGADGKLRRLAQLPLGRDLDQLAGDLADAVLHPRLARLPAAAAEPVELDVGLLGAVARQQLDVLDRQDTAWRRRRSGFPGNRAARRPPRWSAGRRSGRCRDRHARRDRRPTRLVTSAMKFSARLRGAARPHQPVAENVLLADDGGVGGLEAGLRGRARRARPAASAAPAPPATSATVRQIVQPVLGEHVAHALARAFAPQRDDDALAGRLQRLHVLASPPRTRWRRARRARPRNCGRRARRHRSRRRAFRHRERRQPRQRRGVSRSRHSSSAR